MCGYALYRKENKNAKKRQKNEIKSSIDPLPWWIYALSLLLVAGFIVLVALKK